MTRRRISTRERVAIFAAADGRCHICGARIMVGDAWEVSHVTPLELGGADEGDNLKVAHRTCHRILTATEDVPRIRKAQRQHARHIGAKVSRNPMPGSRASGFKKHMDGRVTRRGER